MFKHREATGVICNYNYGEDGNNFRIIIGHLFLISVLLAAFYVIYYFSRKLKFFLVRERAPILGLFQLITFLSLLLIPYICEILIMAGIDWSANSVEEIPTSKKIFKAAYCISRAFSYSTYLFR